MSTGARVTYAMGRDEEMGSHFGLLHGTKMTPHRAIWTLAWRRIWPEPNKSPPNSFTKWSTTSPGS